MGALPLTLVHVRSVFADLPELHAEAEAHVFSRALRPMGYMPLTAEHNTDAISTTSWLWHRDEGSIPWQHPCPWWGDQSGRERAARGTQHRKAQDLLSPLHRLVCAAFTPSREVPLPTPWALHAVGYAANKTAGKRYRKLDWMGQAPLRRTDTYWH